MKAAIFGVLGQALTDEERAFFRDAQPLGFILFARNIGDPDQVRRLVADLRASVDHADAPVLIDQEGGRVQRLRPPHWRAAAPAASFGRLAAQRASDGRKAVFLNHQLIGAELAALGIDVDCAPLIDVHQPGAHDVIGDRAFSGDPEQVAELGRAAADGLMSAGITPVIKHIPGHGRSMVDSHHDLPRVSTPHEELARIDFVPFKRLADLPWGMTAHIVYEAIDPDQPATLSTKVISDVIRGEIGFEGLLLSDDLSMQALRGSLTELAQGSVAAGCDIALHCNGKMEEMVQVAAGAPPLSKAGLERYTRGRRQVRRGQLAKLDQIEKELAVLLA
ncbi:beta-N-acetylhexosaminidase [Dongia deserti]|uniref:beta-N-acetylhexosaminidase n=1 Tax=Dongia deserti TaxID=2268030 RepID=UPI000E65505C|nr:beta-N-acetylhexosaminidase [Dongia deserti]